MITEFLIFLSSILSITWSLIFLISGIFNISIFKISGQKMQIFLREVKYASMWCNDEPEAWILGFWYIGFINKITEHGCMKTELFILCARNFYNINIVKKLDSEANKNKFVFTLYEKEGNAYWNQSYTQREMPCIMLKPRKYQIDIITKIHQDFINRTHTVVLLYGDPGRGKSIIPHLLIKSMIHQYDKITLTDNFNPFLPGEKLINLYNKVTPTKKKPLIIVIEEIDIMINKIHTNNIYQHRDIPTLITSKVDWNMFLDRFDRKLYENVILIMTTNKPIEYFDDLDPSYMRENRVNIKCKV